MTDAEYEAQKARVQALIDRWIDPLGLDSQVRLRFHWWREPVSKSEWLHRSAPSATSEDTKEGVVMHVWCQWQYQTADVEVNLQLAATMDDADLELYFLHELGHVYVAGLAAFRKQSAAAWRLAEEHAATSLAHAFRWLRNSVRAGAPPDPLALNG